MSKRLNMSKTITLRINEENYRLFKMMAERDNRPISNYIETAARRFVENDFLVDEFEMAEIKNNTELNKSIKRALSDVKKGKGKLVG